MKSLARAIAVLEYVLLENGRPVTPSMAAEATGFNLASCARMLGDWVELGYLDKVSRSAGYLPGPMIAALNTRRSIYGKLAAGAAVPLAEFSARIGSRPVNLAVMNHHARVMLAIGCADSGWTPWRCFRFEEDTLDTPTGLLLLSTQPERTIRTILNAGGRPELAARLPRLRREGWIEFADPVLNVTVQGGLLELPGFPAAAVGYGFDAQRFDPAAVREWFVATLEGIRRALVCDYQAL